MRKAFLLLTGLVLGLLSLANDRAVPVSKASGSHSDHTSFFSISGKHLQDIEASNWQWHVVNSSFGKAFPRNHLFVSGVTFQFSVSSVHKLNSSIRQISPEKQYLRHNYPSHNFW